ncbi:alpha/beta fold hydrolase [Marinomonas sp. 2405UD68-3]|uniref:alpha/beta fold hydrolase n=1 Tax=Marinomonas sp. 2405UD68-3 TaxID=3391835 RepID=UPI0039C9FBA8
MKVWILFVVSFAMVACSGQKQELDKNAEITKRVATTPNLLVQHTLQENDYQLHYVSNGNTHNPSILFIHGTPGDWGSFSRYFEDEQLTLDYHINSLDRPGWGSSSYPDGDFPKRLSVQSSLLGPILKDIWRNNGNQKILIIGHSLGGSLVPKIAVDYPEYIKGVLILAGDIGPELAEARWFNYALDLFPKQWIPEFWYNSNQEVLELRPELAQLQEEFRQLSIPIMVLQGTDDDLVRPQNAAFAESLFPNIKVVWLEGASHIINLTHSDDVKTAIGSFH